MADDKASDTPRVDAASRVIDGHAIVPEWPANGGAQEVVSAEFARDLERELDDALRASKEGWRFASECENDRMLVSKELARAMRVVEAAKACVEYDDHESAKKMRHAFWEWEAGR